GLARLAVPLRAAGLDRVNVSLDTLDPDRFAQLAHRKRLPDVLAGLRAAADAGLTPVKLNAVLLRGINDGEAGELLRFALAHGYQLRFIEQMPLDPQHGWDRAQMVSAAEILATLESEFTLSPDPDHRGSAPAETWLVEGYTDLVGRPAKVGVIGTVTRPFCGDCDRTRLTADGQVRNCLFAREESDLRTALRAGASDEELAARWRAAMWTKLPGHGINDPRFLQPARPMSAIGGWARWSRCATSPGPGRRPGYARCGSPRPGGTGTNSGPPWSTGTAPGWARSSAPPPSWSTGWRGEIRISRWPTGQWWTSSRRSPAVDAGGGRRSPLTGRRQPLARAARAVVTTASRQPAPKIAVWTSIRCSWCSGTRACQPGASGHTSWYA